MQANTRVFFSANRWRKSACGKPALGSTQDIIKTNWKNRVGEDAFGKMVHGIVALRALSGENFGLKTNDHAWNNCH
jgi:hypothetical protein